MNSIFMRNQIFCLLGLTSVILLGSNPPVTAQIASEVNATQVNQSLSVTTENKSSQTVAPVPGTVETSSAALVSESTTSNFQLSNQEVVREQDKTKKVAQADIDPGRVTRGGASYVGVAGNIGIGGGESSLGDGNFAVISKVGLTRTFSIRPSAVFGDNTAILVPITYDFSVQSSDDPFTEPLPFAPYVGVGAAIKTGNDESRVGFLVAGGLDVPLNQQFTATAAVNAAFFDETDVGLLLGVGYNFRGF